MEEARVAVLLLLLTEGLLCDGDQMSAAAGGNQRRLGGRVQKFIQLTVILSIASFLFVGLSVDCCRCCCCCCCCCCYYYYSCFCCWWWCCCCCAAVAVTAARVFVCAVGSVRAYVRTVCVRKCWLRARLRNVKMVPTTTHEPWLATPRQTPPTTGVVVVVFVAAVVVIAVAAAVFAVIVVVVVVVVVVVAS